MYSVGVGSDLFWQTNTYETVKNSYEKYTNNWVVIIYNYSGLLCGESYSIENKYILPLTSEVGRICECAGWVYTTSPRLPQQITAIESVTAKLKPLDEIVTKMRSI